MSSTAPALRARVPRLAGAALERARLTVVPKRKRRRTNPVPFLVLVSMLAVGGVVGLLLFNTSMQQASFAATDLQQQADVLEARQQSLQMQLARLRDPQTIAVKAQHMGMVLPTSPAVLDLRSGKVLGQPTPATRLDPLRLKPPPPAKPAELDPKPRVTVVQAGSTGSGHQNSSGNTSRGSHDQGARAGRNDHTSHTQHTSNSHANAGPSGH
jgi:cell division protein FtsB